MGSRWHSQNGPHLHTAATAAQVSTETGPRGLPQAQDTSPPPPPARQPRTSGWNSRTAAHVAWACERHEPALPPPATKAPLSSAIDLATPSSSPSNQFRPVLGLQRQTATSLHPLPLLLIPPGSPLLTSQLQRRERRERHEGKQGRESTRRREEGIDGEEGAEREEGERGKEGARRAGTTHPRDNRSPSPCWPQSPLLRDCS